MEQYISYMYRIYPNDKQKELIAKTFGCTRLVYNTILSLRIPLYNVCKMSWSTFTKFIEDKCKQTGRTFQKIGKFYPSSQICSCCGYQNKNIKSLSIRE